MHIISKVIFKNNERCTVIFINYLNCLIGSKVLIFMQSYSYIKKSQLHPSWVPKYKFSTGWVPNNFRQVKFPKFPKKTSMVLPKILKDPISILRVIYPFAWDPTQMHRKTHNNGTRI